MIEILAIGGAGIALLLLARARAGGAAGPSPAAATKSAAERYAADLAAGDRSFSVPARAARTVTDAIVAAAENGDYVVHSVDKRTRNVIKVSALIDAHRTLSGAALDARYAQLRNPPQEWAQWNVAAESPALRGKVPGGSSWIGNEKAVIGKGGLGFVDMMRIFDAAGKGAVKANARFQAFFDAQPGPRADALAQAKLRAAAPKPIGERVRDEAAGTDARTYSDGSVITTRRGGFRT